MDGKCYKITQTILNSENSTIPSNYITCQDVFHGNKTKSHKQLNWREKNWWKKQKKFAYNKTFINSSV